MIPDLAPALDDEDVTSPVAPDTQGSDYDTRMRQAFWGLADEGGPDEGNGGCRHDAP